MSQFEEFEEGRPATCAVCEAMLPDAVDGTLTAAEQQAFDKHVAGCVTCSRELAEARRGAAWLTLLKGQAPEPPADLLQRILAETTDAALYTAPASASAATYQTPAIPVFAATSVPVRSSLRDNFAQGWRKLAGAFSLGSLEAATQVFQPRMAMTFAMAFFSIALTLNLTGIHLSDIGHAVTQPQSVRRTVADAGAKAERSFQNLRVVYAVESRVSDLRNSAVFGNNGLGEDQAPGELEPGTSGPTTPNQTSQPNLSAPPASAPSSAPVPQQQDTTPQPSGPHGSSNLQFPVEPMTATAPAVRKGV